MWFCSGDVFDLLVALFSLEDRQHDGYDVFADATPVIGAGAGACQLFTISPDFDDIAMGSVDVGAVGIVVNDQITHFAHPKVLLAPVIGVVSSEGANGCFVEGVGTHVRLDGGIGREENGKFQSSGICRINIAFGDAFRYSTGSSGNPRISNVVSICVLQDCQVRKNINIKKLVTRKIYHCW